MYIIATSLFLKSRAEISPASLPLLPVRGEMRHLCTRDPSYSGIASLMRTWQLNNTQRMDLLASTNNALQFSLAVLPATETDFWLFVPEPGNLASPELERIIEKLNEQTTKP